MPVAALIVVGPGIEVKPVKGDALPTNWNHVEERTDVAIEAIFVHAEVRRGVAQSDEARNQPRWFGKKAHLLREQTSRGRIFDHRRPYEPVVPAVQGQVVTHGNYPCDVQESQFGFRAIFSGTRPKQM
jgi:hypothetical protein